IRASAGDPLVQESGLAEVDQRDGEITFVVLPAGENRSASLEHTLQWLRDQSAIGACEDRDGLPSHKILVIAHRMAAPRLGFDGLYESFHASRTLRDAFNEGTAWPLTVFRESIRPLVEAAGSARHQLIPLLMKANPALRDRAASSGQTKDLFAGLSKAVSSL